MFELVITGDLLLEAIFRYIIKLWGLFPLASSIFIGRPSTSLMVACALLMCRRTDELNYFCPETPNANILHSRITTSVLYACTQ